MIVTGFHIEPTNICTLKCPGCARTQFIDKWPTHWKNHSLDISKVMNFLDIDLAGKLINFCGNYGDPIYHSEFIEMVAAFKNRDSHVAITTNGSYRNQVWWDDLCNQLDDRDLIRFSVDGTPDNFTQYRINANWPSIEIGIKTCVQRGIKAEWKYIPFAYNTNSNQQAQELSENLGMSGFQISASDRFDKYTEHLIPNDNLLGKRFTNQQEFKQGLNQSVDPECYQGKSYFITATGHFVPCCYVADHRFYYKTDFGKNSKLYDISNSTFSELTNRPTVINFYQTILQEPATACQFNCPKIK